MKTIGNELFDNKPLKNSFVGALLVNNGKCEQYQKCLFNARTLNMTCEWNFLFKIFSTIFLIWEI